MTEEYKLDTWTKLEIGKKYVEVMEEHEDEGYALDYLHKEYELPKDIIRNMLIDEGMIKVEKMEDHSVKE
jgi:hypothetical protein